MIEHGGLLTEYPKDEIPDRNNFPERNRIVAALSDAVVVVESGEGGGSMITVEYASEYKNQYLLCQVRLMGNILWVVIH